MQLDRVLPFQQRMVGPDGVSRSLSNWTVLRSYEYLKLYTEHPVSFSTNSYNPFNQPIK